MALTLKMREALDVWERRDRRYTEGVVNAQETALIDGQPWIHFRTARALANRGLATISGYGEECVVVVHDSGYRAGTGGDR